MTHIHHRPHNDRNLPRTTCGLQTGQAEAQAHRTTQTRQDIKTTHKQEHTDTKTEAQRTKHPQRHRDKHHHAGTTAPRHKPVMHSNCLMVFGIYARSVAIAIAMWAWHGTWASKRNHNHTHNNTNRNSNREQDQQHEPQLQHQHQHKQQTRHSQCLMLCGVWPKRCAVKQPCGPHHAPPHVKRRFRRLKERPASAGGHNINGDQCVQPATQPNTTITTPTTTTDTTH